MADFLNANAPAIQAISAAAVGITTVVLVFVTWRYVLLTSRLVKTAHEQLQFQRDLRDELAASKRRELITVVKNLQILVGHLPDERNRAERIRDAAMWEDENPTYLQRLASEYDEALGVHAATTVSALRWVKEKVLEVKQIPKKRGFNWDEFPWQRWEQELGSAREGLDAIWSALRS